VEELLKKPQPELLKEIKEDFDSEVTTKSMRQELMSLLPDGFFAINPYRVCWMVNYFSLALISFLALVAFKFEPSAQIMFGLIIGYFNSLLAFSAHEILHGGVVKNKKVEHVLGLIAWAPFFVSPTFWKKWHNEYHHQRTQVEGVDPFAFTSINKYESSAWERFLFNLKPGSESKWSYLYFFFGFSLKMHADQLYFRFRRKDIHWKEHVIMSVEYLAQVGFFFILADLVTWEIAASALIIPFIIQNYLVGTSFFIHHKPKTTAKALSDIETVSSFPLDYLNHFNGFQQAHYLFSEVPFSRLPKLNQKLKETYPNHYQKRPKWKVLKEVYTLPPVLNESGEHFHPVFKKSIKVKS
jgi:fatty acid desaturase